MRPKASQHFSQKTLHGFRRFSDGSYDFMKNEQRSDETERKSAKAATVC